MLLSDAPSPIQLAFAASGAKNTIPVPSQISVTAGRASYTDGFPPLTRTPLSAGGVPPFGEDMNGILYAITAIQRWQSSGGFFPFSSTQATAIGGYPLGTILVKAAGTGYWQSLIENNSNDPDAGGSGWADLGASLSGRPGAAYSANDYCWLDKAAGLMLKWGQGTFPNSGGSVSTVTIVFPTAFPNAALFAFGIAGGAANSPSGGYPAISRTGLTAAQATFAADTLGFTTWNQSAPMTWFAIGR